MTERKEKNNSIYLVIGIFLCLLCVMCIGILVYALVSTSAEKTRLESIGATVTMKFTWLFFADILAVIISGVMGILLFGKSKETKHEPIIHTPPEYNHPETPVTLPPVSPAIPSETPHSLRPVTTTETPTTDEKVGSVRGSGLRINHGGSGKKPVSGEEGVSVRIEPTKKTEGSSFFSAGDDL